MDTKVLVENLTEREQTILLACLHEMSSQVESKLGEYFGSLLNDEIEAIVRKIANRRIKNESHFDEIMAESDKAIKESEKLIKEHNEMIKRMKHGK